jgi:hypothetical protein
LVTVFVRVVIHLVPKLNDLVAYFAVLLDSSKLKFRFDGLV